MQNDIRDIKGPLSLPWEMGFWEWLAVGLAIGMAGALLFWWRRRRREKVAVSFTPPLSLAQETLRQLDELKEEHLPENGRAQEFFFRLSAILRRYLERRFGIPASEQTTEEFLAETASKDFLKEEQKKTLKTFMEHSDLVKYAKASAGLQECVKGDGVVRQLVDETSN